MAAPPLPPRAANACNVLKNAGAGKREDTRTSGQKTINSTTTFGGRRAPSRTQSNEQRSPLSETTQTPEWWRRQQSPACFCSAEHDGRKHTHTHTHTHTPTPSDAYSGACPMLGSISHPPPAQPKQRIIALHTQTYVGHCNCGGVGCGRCTCNERAGTGGMHMKASTR